MRVGRVGWAEPAPAVPASAGAVVLVAPAVAMVWLAVAFGGVVVDAGRAGLASQPASSKSRQATTPIDRARARRGRAQIKHLTVVQHRFFGDTSILHQAFGLIVQFQIGQHFLVADAPARVAVHLIDELRNGLLTIADHVARYSLGHRHQLVVDDQHPVIEPGHKALHQNGPAFGVFLGLGKGGFHLVILGQVDRHTAPVVGIQRFDHHRITDPLCAAHRLARIVNHALLRHRQAQIVEQIVGVFLVAGYFHRDMAGLRGDRRLNPLLVLAVPELDQRIIIQPEPRDTTLFGGLDQRSGRGAEFLALGAQHEGSQLFLPVELGIKIILDLGLKTVGQKMHQEPQRQLPRCQSDIALTVLVDHVVLRRVAGATGPAKGDLSTGDTLNFQRAMLHDMAHPGTLILAQTPDEPARLAVGTSMFVKTGQGCDQTANEFLTDPRRGPFFKHTKIDNMANDREPRPDIGPYKDIG